MRKLLLMVALALAAGAGSPAAVVSAAAEKPALIPIPDFAALPMLRKPLLSPDGRSIAARRTTDGKTTIVVLDADRPEAPARVIQLGKAEVYSLSWAGNQRLLLTVLTTRHFFHSGVDVPFLRLISVDVPTGLARVVDRKSQGVYGGDVLYADPTGSWALVASQDFVDTYPSVKRVDLNSGDSVIVEKPRDRVWDWYADEHGVVRAGVAYDARRWTVWYRDKPDEKLRAVKGRFEKDDDSAVDKFIFRGKNSWILTNERTGRFGLYKFDLKTGAIGETIFEHPQVDVDDALYDPITGSIAAIEYEDDRRRTVWFEPELKALQAKLDKALPDAVNLATDWSTDKQRVLVWSASASDPGRYFLLDRKTSRMHAVVAPYPKIDPVALAPVKMVRYAARDGLSLPAYLTLPRGRDQKGLPLIVMPHGGPFERDHWEYDAIVQFLANRGYAVLQPQFRGSTGYGKEFVSRGYGEWGRKMQDDLDDGVDWLARTGQIDPKRVCLVGASYGGYAALWGAARNPERYRCAASMSGVADLSSMLRYDRKLFSATRYFREWRSKVGGEGKGDLASISPINFAARVKVPLLIGHGEDDDNVPVSQSRGMVEALRKANADVTSVFYKDGGHGFTSSQDLGDWLKRLEAFLAKHNPA